MFAATPEPPYVAVIFTTRRSDDHAAEYVATDEAMERLAANGVDRWYEVGAGSVLAVLLRSIVPGAKVTV